MNQQELNTSNARAFYDLMFNHAQPAQAIARYVGDVYIQHNPDVADGKAAFIDYFTRMAEEYPDKQVFFKRTVAEGNLVVLHCHQVWPGDQEYSRYRHLSFRRQWQDRGALGCSAGDSGSGKHCQLYVLVAQRKRASSVLSNKV